MNQKRVLGLGNPLIDICAEVGPGTVISTVVWFKTRDGRGMRLYNCEKDISSAGILN